MRVIDSFINDKLDRKTVFCIDSGIVVFYPFLKRKVFIIRKMEKIFSLCGQIYSNIIPFWEI